MRARLLIALCFTALLMNCGGSSSPAPSIGGGIIPPVQASSGFTVANLSGGYAFASSGNSGGLAEAGAGVITADGNGNLTAGEETDNIGGTTICHTFLAGTYTVNSNGTGTATVTITPDAASIASGCASGTASLALALANGGSSLVLSSLSPNEVTLLTAIKQ